MSASVGQTTCTLESGIQEWSCPSVGMRDRPPDAPFPLREVALFPYPLCIQAEVDSPSSPVLMSQAKDIAEAIGETP